jgi:hypothetical protein
LFARAGFISTAGRPAPTEPLVIWRGQRDRRAPKMSWTTDRDRAVWFAHRYGLVSRPSVLYRAVAPPEAVLAFIDSEHDRAETEVIVNPHLLRDVEKVSMAL